MGTVTDLRQSPGKGEVSAEIAVVLASESFNRAPSLAQFLGYVCRKALSGEAGQIKEYNIAVEAFGRPPDFDQKEDAIVRVEAHRLRKRLTRYYETEGASHPIEIVIPAGQYVPEFVWKEAAASEAATVEAGAVEGDAATGGEKEDLSRSPLAPVPGSAEAASSGSAGAPSTAVTVLPEVIHRGAQGGRPRRWWPAAAAVAGIVLIAVAVSLFMNRKGSPAPAATQAPADGGSGGEAGMPEASGAAEEGVRIACGMTAPKYIDSAANTWVSDRYALGGEVLSTPANMILRTRDPALFQSRRQGDFRYDIPLDPGVYELHLFFAERVFGPGNPGGGGESTRLFHVFVNGTPVMELLDIVADAAGSNTADVRVFKDITPAPDGFLHLRFSPFKEAAFINAIAVLPGKPGKMRPVRLAGSNSAVRDSAGRVWNPDQYALGGQVTARNNPVSGTRYPEIYHSERFGNFNYVIPVAEGRYSVTLHFIEAWFGHTTTGIAGEGKRLFDVHCNGSTLLKSFDIFKAAGGEGRAIERTFHGLTPNAQGKLELSFVPVKNYATVSAIEVLAE